MYAIWHNDSKKFFYALDEKYTPPRVRCRRMYPKLYAHLEDAEHDRDRLPHPEEYNLITVGFTELDPKRRRG